MRSTLLERFATSTLAHTLELNENARVHAYGNNDYGALGVGSGGMMSIEMKVHEL